MRRPLCCVCAAFVVTVFLYLKINPAPEPVKNLVQGERVTLLGEVCQKEYQCKYQKTILVIQLKNVQEWSPDLKQSAKKTDACNVICYIEAEEGLTVPKAGSVIAVEGEVAYFDRARNPGEFDAQEYYQILGVDFRLYQAEIQAESSGYSIYHEILYQIRYHLEGIFDRTLAPKDASIMKAMLLGNKSGLDDQSKQLFQKSGIAHILAISGLHITLLGMGLYKLLRKLYIPQSVCAVVSVGLMIAYGDMVGMSSSAYRAVFMFAMQLAAQLLRRTYDMLTALALAAVLILLEQPLYLYHTGFQLSFGAILGVGCLSEVVCPARRGKKQHLTDRIALSLCGSLSIFLIHFPVMLCVYYEFPIYSFLLNLVVIPAMSLLMAAGLICLGAGSLPAALGFGMAKIMGLVCHVILSMFEWLCVTSLKLPFANWIVGRPEKWRIYAFCSVVLFLYAAHHYGKHISKEKACENRGINVGLPLSVKYMTVLAAVILLSHSSVDGVSMTFLDVGQGDCIWIESAGGEHFLVDGGSSSKSKVGEYTMVPYLKYSGVSNLDAVFLTHLDSDHTSGVMELLEGNSGNMDIGISRICISDAVMEDEAYEKLAVLCEARQIPIYRLKAGDSIEANGLRMEILHPQKDYETDSRNAYSLVMKLETENGVTALLTGDVEADGEQAAAKLLGKETDFRGIDIYKTAHHGSRYSNTEELISLARPRLAVISCGEDNRYGHPHVETIERLENTGSEIRITKDTGAIMIKIKNGKYRVENYIKCAQ